MFLSISILLATTVLPDATALKKKSLDTEEVRVDPFPLQEIVVDDSLEDGSLEDLYSDFEEEEEAE